MLIRTSRREVISIEIWWRYGVFKLIMHGNTKCFTARNLNFFLKPLQLTQKNITYQKEIILRSTTCSTHQRPLKVKVFGITIQLQKVEYMLLESFARAESRSHQKCR